jgi:hypothetical protein
MTDITDKQETNLERRVVTAITRYPQPKEIFDTILENSWEYSVDNQEAFSCRDRALTSLCECTAGRITEVTGGPKFQRVYISGLYPNPKDKRNWQVEVIGKHSGLKKENLTIDKNFIHISGMTVVKRSKKVLAKHGNSAATRPDFVIPLKTGLFDNPFWDQLVPFGWLIIEYMKRFEPKTEKLFPFEDTRAYQIIREVTGNYPNWFRAQAENFYGHYLLTDTIKLSKFVNIQDPKHVKHYIGYSWDEQLKDKTLSMNFDWIEPAVEQIKKRIGTKPLKNLASPNMHH